MTLFTWHTKAQYPFEKYPAIKYRAYNDWKTYDNTEKEGKVDNTLTIPNFFKNGDKITIQLTSFSDHWWNNSVIDVFRNKIKIQTFIEDMGLNPTGLDTLRVADINGDGLQDIKIISAYMGNGTASLNARVIYLFQKTEHTFRKISFSDKMGKNKIERDFDKDGNFEIITMNLLGYREHSYWLFNIFNYKDGRIVNVNAKENYPIMIQFLYREDYKITNNISRKEMKNFAHYLPDDYDDN